MTDVEHRRGTSGSAASVPGCDCKVGRTSEEYGLPEVAASLADRWAAGDASLRELADRYNRRLLGAAMRGAGMRPVDGEVRNLYRLLTDGEVSAGTRVEARRRLEEGGVDPDAVEADFVSYGTINRHLKRCVGVEGSDPGTDPAEAVERIRALRNRTEAVAEDALDGVRRGDVTLGTTDVFVDVRVTCEDCGARVDLDRLEEGEGCDCG